METADAAWAPYAKSHGYTLRASNDDHPTRVSGKRDEVSIAFELASHAGDWGITAVGVPLAPVHVRLELAPEGVMSKIGKLFGSQDIVLGEKAFDDRYMVKGTNEEGARKVLVHETRAAMLDLGVTTFTYDDGSSKERSAVIVASIPTLFTEPAQLDRLVDFLVAVAKIHP